MRTPLPVEVLMRAILTVAISSGLILALSGSAHAQVFGMRHDRAAASSVLFLRPGDLTLARAVGVRQDAEPVRDLPVGNSATLLLPGSPSLPSPSRHLALVQATKKRTGTTLMIIGGAGIIAGGIIGGTEGALIGLGGVGIGAYGVYLFVNA
jgi:hypothetical protein